MKTLGAQLGFFLRGTAKRSLKLLLAYVGFLVVLVLVFSWLFVFFMQRLEGQEYSYVSGVYWTITVMTTLGFGDITFQTDPGRVFAGIVTLSGFLFLLVLLPFGLISLFMAPWLEERLRSRASKELPEGTRGHVLISGWDPVARMLVARLAAKGVQCAVLVEDDKQALHLESMGVSVVHGIPTDESALISARLDTARALVANMRDTDNANLILTALAFTDTPVIAVADSPEGSEILELAGAHLVVSVKDVLGRYIGVRTTVRGAYAHVVDTYEGLLFAEMPVLGTRLAGTTLAESRLRETAGVSVAGVWRRGRFSPATAGTALDDESVILFTATAATRDSGGDHRDGTLRGSGSRAHPGVRRGGPIGRRLPDRERGGSPRGGPHSHGRAAHRGIHRGRCQSPRRPAAGGHHGSDRCGRHYQ